MKRFSTVQAVPDLTYKTRDEAAKTGWRIEQVERDRQDRKQRENQLSLAR